MRTGDVASYVTQIESLEIRDTVNSRKRGPKRDSLAESSG